jgi:hypothetical protein
LKASAALGSVPRMLRTTPRLRLCLAALLIFVGCGTAQGAIKIERVQKADIKVLPGQGGFTNPLTGIVSYSPQDWQKRRALGIKVGNSSNERPQSGIHRADLVYEEIVEGGVTRFLAVFLTNEAPRVGPVRSVRNADADIMAPLKGLFGYSGGVPPVISKLRGTGGVSDVGANVVGGAYRRDSDRQAPYNLYTATDRLWSGRAGSPPPAMFEFLSSNDDPATGGGPNANEVKFSFANNSDEVRYLFDSKAGRYQRYVGQDAHRVEGERASAEGEKEGIHLGFSNILIQKVDVSAGSTVDTRGQASSEIKLIGSGPAALARGGKILSGRWERQNAGSPTRFIGADGTALKLAPGTTIVELLPSRREFFVT